MIAQFRDVLAAFPQRRDDDVEDVQPVVEILAERLRLHPSFQVLVRRRDDPHVRVDHLRSADPRDLLLLDGAQELRLDRRRDVPDLVEEERPPLGVLELPGPGGGRPRERPLLVAEELGLEERLRDRGAVQRQEGPVRAGAQSVDPPGDEFLPRAAFPGDQDVHPGRGDEADLSQYLFHRAGGSDDPLDPERPAGLLAEPLDLPAHPALLERLEDGGPQTGNLHGLEEEIRGAGAHRLDRPLDGAVGRQDDHRDVRDLLRDVTEHLEAGQARHPQVGDDDVTPLGLDARQSFPRVGEGEHVEAVAAQRDDDALEAVGVVVEDEDTPLLLLVQGLPPCGSASGRRPGNIARNCSSNRSATVIVVPFPSRLRT